MNRLVSVLASVFERNQIWFSSKEKDDRTIYDLTHALLGSSGEVSGAVLAYKILDRYPKMSKLEKMDFFGFLASELDIDPNLIRSALVKYESDPTSANYNEFMASAEPKRQELIRRLNKVPNATGKLVIMRKELLSFAKEDKKLSVIDLDFKHLFSSWFNLGFLVLRPINWQTSADTLEKIIQYEAVHEITSWDDLRRRLQPEDRRCFAFFHPAIPDEPLIFVEVALTKGIPNSIQTVLDEFRVGVEPSEANSAIFYSISNCQAGLAGISFGNSLIKQVVADLSRELPNLSCFSTLSPMPRFKRWLESENRYLDDMQQDEIKSLAVQYLLEVKNKDGLPLDPVGRFHLGNGALVHAIHNDANTSDRGMAESLGVMVNYLYDLPNVTTNHEQFVTDKKIAVSTDVKNLNKIISTAA